MKENAYICAIIQIEFVGRANETDPSYTTSMLIFGFTALGAAVTAIAMWYIDRRKGYGLQLPNIKD